MPITLILTEGLVPPERQPATMARLSEAFLRLHGLSGNTALTPNIIGHVQSIPDGSTYAGLKPTKAAIVEWLTPSFAFSSHEVRSAYVKEATDIVEEACEGRLPRESIWVNMRHAVDGGWGIAGQAYRNEELIEMVSRG
jgi:hypothetical protein